MLERAQDVGKARPRMLGLRLLEPLVELDLERPSLTVAEVPAYLVVRDRQQPVLGLARLRPLGECAVGLEERLLRDVLGVRSRAEHREGVAEDGSRVLTVQPVELGCLRRTEECGHHRHYACRNGRLGRANGNFTSEARRFCRMNGSTTAELRYPPPQHQSH